MIPVYPLSFFTFQLPYIIFAIVFSEKWKDQVKKKAKGRSTEKCKKQWTYRVFSDADNTEKLWFAAARSRRVWTDASPLRNKKDKARNENAQRIEDSLVKGFTYPLHFH